MAGISWRVSEKEFQGQKRDLLGLKFCSCSMAQLGLRILGHPSFVLGAQQHLRQECHQDQQGMKHQRAPGRFNCLDRLTNNMN